MKSRVGMAVICLHISAVIYLLLGCLFLAIPSFVEGARDFPMGLGIAGFLFGLAWAAGNEVVAAGLRRRKFWAWIAGLCIFGLYVPSLFLPLGALGFWGLLDSGSLAEFGVGAARSGKPSGPSTDDALAGDA